jgi:hypothetical protein
MRGAGMLYHVKEFMNLVARVVAIIFIQTNGTRMTRIFTDLRW